MKPIPGLLLSVYHGENCSIQWIKTSQTTDWDQARGGFKNTSQLTFNLSFHHRPRFLGLVIDLVLMVLHCSTKHHFCINIYIFYVYSVIIFSVPVLQCNSMYYSQHWLDKIFRYLDIQIFRYLDIFPFQLDFLIFAVTLPRA